MIRDGARQVLRSRWLPAVLVGVALVAVLREAALVPLSDQARFAGYLLGWIVLPGTLAWKAVDRRAPRPLIEDLSVGALVGYVLEFPAYATALAVGHPRWYLAWPLLVGGTALVVRAVRGRRRGPRPPRPRFSRAWSWALAAAIGYVLLWWSHHVAGPSPSAGPALRAPYVDEPYHLSVVASLRRSFPPEVLFVTDTDLDYHYLSHLHMAAGSWASGVEPAVVLSGLALPLVAVCVLVALACVAARLTERTWAGPVAVAGVLVVPADLSGWRTGGTPSFLDVHLRTSPSAAFVTVGLLLGITLTLLLLRGELRDTAAWALTALTFLALPGQKVTALPMLIAGLLAATALTLALPRRRRARTVIGLTALAMLCFLLARRVFFGASTHGLTVDPLGFLSLRGRAFPGILDGDGSMSTGVAVLALTSLLGWFSLVAVLLTLALRRGWRQPEHVFLVVLCASGFGAALTFHQVGYSEGYFITAAQVPLLLGAALGLARLGPWWGPGPRRTAVVCLALGLLGGLVIVAATAPVDGEALTGTPLAQAARVFVIPAAVLVVTTGLLAVVALRMLRRGGQPRPAATLVAALVLAGVGLTPTVRDLPALLADPAPAAQETTPGLIGEGGILAARWLRAHTGRDAVVATNAHCARPRGTCRPLNFWMAGYAERPFLLEGWGYVSRTSAGLDPPADEDVVAGPFWDAALLARNDALFADPTPERAAALRSRHGVGWLLVDRRYPADVSGLREVADLRLRSGVYSVFELR